MSRALVFAISTAMLASAGCDLLQPKVSKSELEQALRDWLTSNELVAKTVSCPDDQPMKKGHTFECTAEVHGTDIPVAVEVTDPSTGMVEWKPKFLTVKRDSFEQEVAANPAFVGHDLKLDCHDAVWVSIPESEWKCDITDRGDGDKQYIAVITFSDGEGTHAIEIKPKG